MSASPDHLAAWTWETVHLECRDAYRRYSRELDAHYSAYFAHHPEERGAHPRQARDLERALPPGWDHCADDLPPPLRHRHYLSGRSSQVLAVGLFCPSAQLEPSLDWLFEALSVPARDPLGLPSPLTSDDSIA